MSESNKEKSKIDDLEQLTLKVLSLYSSSKETLKREVGNSAVWSVSSCKSGHGVHSLRDDCADTFWQSDGRQPHWMNIQFFNKTTIHSIELLLNYELDQSYTPNKISIRAGNDFQDIREIEKVELDKSSCWTVIPFHDAQDGPIRAFFLQIAVLSNHDNGRDSRIRLVKIHSPVKDTIATALDFAPKFSTVELMQHVHIR